MLILNKTLRNNLTLVNYAVAFNEIATICKLSQAFNEIATICKLSQRKMT